MARIKQLLVLGVFMGTSAVPISNYSDILVAWKTSGTGVNGTNGANVWQSGRPGGPAFQPVNQFQPGSWYWIQTKPNVNLTTGWDFPDFVTDASTLGTAPSGPSGTYAISAEGDSLTADERPRTTLAYPGNSYSGAPWSWFKQWQTSNTDSSLVGFNNYAVAGDIVQAPGMLDSTEQNEVLAGRNASATENWLYLLAGINNIQSAAGPQQQTDGIAIGQAAYERVRQMHVYYTSNGYKTIAYCLTYSRATSFSSDVQAVMRTAVDKFNQLMRQGFRAECKASLLIDLTTDPVLGPWENVVVGTQQSAGYIDALHYSEPGAGRLRDFAVRSAPYLKAGTVGILTYSSFSAGDGAASSTTLVAQTPAVVTEETSPVVQVETDGWDLTQGSYFSGNQGRVCTTPGKRIAIVWRGTSLSFATPRANGLGQVRITVDGEVDGSFSQHAPTTENSAFRYKTNIVPDGLHITYYEMMPGTSAPIWFDTVTANTGETVEPLGNAHPGFMLYLDASYSANTAQKWFDKSDYRKHALQLTPGNQMELTRDYFGPGLHAYTRPNDTGNFVVPALASIRTSAGLPAAGEYTIYALLRSDEETWFFENMSADLQNRQLLTVNSSLGAYYDYANGAGRGGVLNGAGAATLVVYKLYAGQAEILRNGVSVWTGDVTPFAFDGVLQLGSAGEDNAEKQLGIAGGLAKFAIYNGRQTDAAIRAESVSMVNGYGINIP